MTCRTNRKQRSYFWREKPIEQMTEAEWESLCDGCGLCCQIRVEDVDTGEIALSDAACRLLDLCTHRCKDYEHRQERVPDCVKVTPENVRSLNWLPHTCAYRLVAFGHDLPRWHHLVCGDPERVHTVGPSMRGCLVSEDEVEWPALDDPE
ncbi:YcgN family cysteine cluster protein [Benzoatithermus flavus]|uniref:YcgN family cysteine cluster protein n=1 Tax=Benzoatithermus flavus TaxID=3108223 RepID=A0ABU8XTP5_9PROT